MKHILETSNRSLTLVFEGDVVSTNAGVLRQEAFAILESEVISRADWQTLHLDLRAANMIDSMGLNLLVSIIKFAKNRGSKVTGRVANTNVQRTIMFTRLDTQMELLAA
jgi:anti-anti-sigma factor